MKIWIFFAIFTRKRFIIFFCGESATARVSNCVVSYRYDTTQSLYTTQFTNIMKCLGLNFFKLSKLFLISTFFQYFSGIFTEFLSRLVPHSFSRNPSRIFWGTFPWKSIYAFCQLEFIFSQDFGQNFVRKEIFFAIFNKHMHMIVVVDDVAYSLWHKS